MREVHVAIAGGGPRGLTVLERIIANAALYPNLFVHFIDPGEAGQGSHPSHQPQYLLTNTLASQVTIFSPRDLDDPLSESTGPSFTDWARETGYRRMDDAFSRALEGKGAMISDDDYLPRALLGEYLTFSYNRIVAKSPSYATVRRHYDLVADLQLRDDERILIELKSGFRMAVDYVFLTTGHCENKPNDDDLNHEDFVLRNRIHNSRLDFFPSIYPTSQLDRIAPEATVAVQGLGLTAYDVVASLTLGRGGSFIAQGALRRYVPSGAEPKISLFLP